MKFSKALLLSSFAVAGLIASLSASAEKRLYSHWESFGSSGDPGGVTYKLVIDGWYDDGTDVGPQRFPNAGTRGGAISHLNKGRKIDGRLTPGKGCTLAENTSGIKGLPAGTRTWSVFISPYLDLTNQIAFRKAIAAVNTDQQQRGRKFRLTEVPTAEEARVFITDPKPGVFTPLPGNDAMTDVRFQRNGDIARTWTIANPTTDLDYAMARAGHEIGHALGLADIETYDPNYPSQMFKAIAVIDKNQGLDTCTASAIDANVNRSGN